MSGWGFGMGLGWITVLLLVAAFVYFMNGNRQDGPSAREILDRRYARGEIDEQEYKRKRKFLEEREGSAS